MANLTPSESWDDIIELPTATNALGGPGGPMNLQAQQLLNRFQYLLGASGASKVWYSQGTTESKARPLLDKNRETCSPDDFNGADDYERIQNAFDEATVSIDFGSKTYTFTGADFPVATRAVTMISRGATFIQTLWGYPAIEIRTPGVRMEGSYKFRYNGVRTAVIAADTLGYGWPSGNWKDYSSAILVNSTGYTVDDTFIDQVHVYGFINSVWFNGARSQLNFLEFDTCDMGAVGGPGDDCVIGVVKGKNVTNSQTVEGHVLYLVASVPKKNLMVGSVAIDGSNHGAALIKMQGYENFTIGSISGSGTGAIGNFRAGCSGVIGEVAVSLTTATYIAGGITYALLAHGAGTSVKVGVLSIKTSQSASDCLTLTQSSDEAELFIGKLIINGTTSAAAQPRASLVTGLASLFVDNPVIEFPNSTCTNYAFDLGSYSKVVINNPYLDTGGTDPLLLRNTYSAGQRYHLALNPNLIVDGITANSIICTAGVSYFAEFVADNTTPIGVTGSFPIVTHGTIASVSQAADADLKQLRRASPGQKVVVINSDGKTNLNHNTLAGSDGNILTKTGAQILKGAWTIALFQKVGTDMVQIA